MTSRSERMVTNPVIEAAKVTIETVTQTLATVAHRASPDAAAALTLVLAFESVKVADSIEGVSPGMADVMDRMFSDMRSAITRASAMLDQDGEDGTVVNLRGGTVVPVQRPDEPPPAA